MTPNYYNIAVAEIGQREIEGLKSNPRILEYQTAAGYNAKQDDVAWCGSFVSWVLKQANIPYRFQTAAQAADWANFGRPIKEPVVGTIMVWPHHVGFFAGWVDKKAGSFRLLSGNSGGAAAGGGEVRISTYKSMNGVIAMRFPKQVPIPQTAKNPLDSNIVKGTAGIGAALVPAIVENQDVIMDSAAKVQERFSEGKIIGMVALVVILLVLGYFIYKSIDGNMRAKKFASPPKESSSV